MKEGQKGSERRAVKAVIALCCKIRILLVPVKFRVAVGVELHTAGRCVCACKQNHWVRPAKNRNVNII